MRLLYLSAAVIATVQAGVCDPSKLRTEFFMDAECKQLNETMTKQFEYLPKDYWFMHSGKCEVKYPGKEWVIFNCDEKGFHEEMFQDDKCTVPITYVKTGRVDFPWNECVSVPEVSPQTMRVYTTQRDFTYNWQDNMTTSSDHGGAAQARKKRANMQFDKYFYYAIDHQGREPGSLEPGCMSSRECDDGPRDWDKDGKMDDKKDWDKDGKMDDKKDWDKDGKMDDKMDMDKDKMDDKMKMEDGKMDDKMKMEDAKMDDKKDWDKDGKMSKEDKIREARRKDGGKMGGRMCCARATLHEKRDGGRKHDIMRCMDKKVVRENSMMEMDKMTIEMDCVDGRWNSASGLMVAASTIGLVAMNLF